MLADLEAEHLVAGHTPVLNLEARNHQEGSCVLYVWAVTVQVCHVMSMDGQNPHLVRVLHVTEDTMRLLCAPLAHHRGLLDREEQNLQLGILAQDGLFYLKLTPSSQKFRGFPTSGSNGNP